MTTNSGNEWRRRHHLPALSSRPDVFYGRLETDVGNTAFNEGKEFRLSREFVFTESTPITFRFTSPVDFILQRQSVTVDTGNLRFRAYREDQGTPTGTFGTQEDIISNNGTRYTKQLSPLVTIDSGGGFDITPGEPAKETIRLRTSGATAQRTSVSGEIGDERGLPAGTYYLIFERIDGTGTTSGVYDLKWEELRPDE